MWMGMSCKAKKVEALVGGLHFLMEFPWNIDQYVSADKLQT